MTLTLLFLLFLEVIFDYFLSCYEKGLDNSIFDDGESRESVAYEGITLNLCVLAFFFTLLPLLIKASLPFFKSLPFLILVILCESFLSKLYLIFLVTFDLFQNVLVLFESYEIKGMDQ